MYLNVYLNEMIVLVLSFIGIDCNVNVVKFGFGDVCVENFVVNVFDFIYIIFKIFLIWLYL